MFTEITDVPLNIRDFYQEVTVTEPKLDAEGNPVFSSEPVPAVDEFGNETTNIIQVPVFEDVTYVELKPRLETKTLEDLHRVNNIHKGSNAELIERFALMVRQDQDYKYLDSYLAWLDERSQLAEVKPRRAINEAGEFIQDDPDTEINEMWENGFTPGMYDAQLAEFDTTEPQPPEPFDTNAWIQEHFIPLRHRYLKLKGVEINGVMCSVTKEDQWGISSIQPLVMAGNAINFEFENGSYLELNSSNMQSFLDVWLAYRAKFFTPNKEI